MRALVFVVLLITAQADAQMDSLLRVRDALPQDTSRLGVLTELLRATVFNDPDSALVFAAEYRSIAKRSGIDLEIGKGHNYTGMCYTSRSEHDEALRHYLAAVPYFERGGDPWYEAMAHNNIGSVHEKMQRSDKAAYEFTAALRAFRSLRDTVWIANVSNNLGNVLYEEGRFDSAVVYYRQADDLLTALGMDIYAGTTRMNLSNALDQLGAQDEALAMMRSAHAVMPEGEDENTRANILANLGRLHGVAGEADSALYFLRAGLQLAQRAQARSVETNAHEFLSAFFEERGAIDSAYRHHKLATALRDSIFSQESSARIAEMQEKYESGKKDVLIAEGNAQLERRALTIKAIAVGAVLFLVAALFAFRAYRVKRKGEAEMMRQKQVIEAQLKEKELLLREIHHRVKNNLQTVSSLLSIQGRGITDETAKQAVNDSRLRVKSMALIHQDLYREGDLTGVQMPDYVAKLANGLVTSYGMTDRVKLDLRVHPINLDVDTAVPLGLILNELITNALKYAWPDGRSGRLHVSMAEAADGQLLIDVIDDGIGMKDGAQVAAGGTGFGLGMIRTFASKLKAEHTITGENGTSVRLVVRSYRRTG
ncbi:MAG: tetratricopeptide repeat protein [Flavobacteriales bacterium]|nr:MAG: tetratricopeptide repeat protein [Flavobacteriales bacterium]